MLPFVEDLDVDNLHVHAPTEVVFICGGRIASPDEPPASLRDAFNRVVVHPALNGREPMYAEPITKLHVFSAFYADLLEFESDFAEITELIILFCESAGSFAELGTFVSNREISKRLLVVIRDYYEKEGSYINLGPLSFLRRIHNHSVFVTSDKDLNIRDENYAEVNLENFRKTLDGPLRLRLSATRTPTTFEVARPGHVIKLMVGLIQEYGALTTNELLETVALFGVCLTAQRAGALLLCATEIGWVQSRAIGFRTFYYPLEEKRATDFRLKDAVADKDRVRRRLAIRTHWKANDIERFRFIGEVAKGAA